MRIVLDPWGGDYGSQISTPHEADTDDTMVQVLDEEGEQCPWKPINPSPTTLPLETVVVDGVMRSDAFGIFYMAINIGAMISQFALPYVRTHYGYQMAFAFPENIEQKPHCFRLLCSTASRAALSARARDRRRA